MTAANICEAGLGNLKDCKEIFRNYGDRNHGFYAPFSFHTAQ